MENKATSAEPRLVEIGVIGKPHGVRGEARLFLHNPDSEVLWVTERVFVGREPCTAKIFEVESVRRGSRWLIIAFSGFETREEAEALVGSRVFVSREELPEPAEDEFYVDDLLGLEAWDRSRRLGVVTACRCVSEVEYATVAGDLEALEVPLVDPFLEKIDFESGRLLLKDTDELPRFQHRKHSKT